MQNLVRLVSTMKVASFKVLQLPSPVVTLLRFVLSAITAIVPNIQRATLTTVLKDGLLHIYGETTLGFHQLHIIDGAVAEIGAVEASQCALSQDAKQRQCVKHFAYDPLNSIPIKGGDGRCCFARLLVILT